MNCPKCKQPLVTCEIRGIELDFCAKNHGCWFDEGEIEALLHGRVPVVPADKNGTKGNRRCPRCKAKMNVHRPFEGLELDLCPYGDGIWFDATELGTLSALLKGRRLSGELDHLDTVFNELATKLGGTP